MAQAKTRRAGSQSASVAHRAASPRPMTMVAQGYTIEYPRGASKVVRAIVAAVGADGKVPGRAIHDILPARRVFKDGIWTFREALGLVGAKVVRTSADRRRS